MHTHGAFWLGAVHAAILQHLMSESRSLVRQREHIPCGLQLQLSSLCALALATKVAAAADEGARFVELLECTQLARLAPLVAGEVHPRAALVAADPVAAALVPQCAAGADLPYHVLRVRLLVFQQPCLDVEHIATT